MRKLYRQGDVLLVSARVPKEATAQKRDGRIVLALGEATGHAHVITDPAVEVLVREGEVYVRSAAGFEVTHEEHRAVPVPPGTYRVVRQREYSAEAIRQVAD